MAMRAEVEVLGRIGKEIQAYATSIGACGNSQIQLFFFVVVVYVFDSIIASKFSYDYGLVFIIEQDNIFWAFV